MGCGAACVAFAAGIPYQQAVNALGKHKSRTSGYQLKEIVNALSYYGMQYKFKHVKPKNKQSIYQDGAIVFIRRSTKYPYGHYLIRHQGLWADPWINLVHDKDLRNAQSGYRKRLPGQAQWAVLPITVTFS
jgi:hypothetical protein